MENQKTIRLTEPLEIGGKEVTELEIRRATIGDEEDAMQMAVQLKRARNPLTVEMVLLSKLARIPYDKLRSMCPQDYASMRAALNELSGLPKPEDDENPMTRDGI